MTTETKAIKVPIFILSAVMTALMAVIGFSASQMVKAQDKIADKVEKLSEKVELMRGQVGDINVITDELKSDVKDLEKTVYKKP